MIVLELGAVPAKPLSMNETNLHWAVRRARTDPWKHLAWATATNAGLAQALNAMPCVVTVVIPVPDKRRRDPHNYAPVSKAVVDGLVKAGVWPDDNPRYVTVTEPKLVYDRRRTAPASVYLVPRES